MAKKKEVEVQKKEAILNVWASPAWSIKHEGTQIRLESGCGFFPNKRDGLVELEINIKEV